ncbi:hypothetical protein LCGC14_2036120 [marine sediment metagenome]|uniref:Uncharacterized protein n=1 Tax=marine sediment metagenome TaxID=412755 RepID=A0A0F9ET79_9ZZZZ|nr:hypothetical protein [Pricia sp.]
MKTVIIRNYSCGIAEIWIDKKLIGTIGDTLITRNELGRDKFGMAYKAQMVLLKDLGQVLNFTVKS